MNEEQVGEQILLLDGGFPESRFMTEDQVAARIRAATEMLKEFPLSTLVEVRREFARIAPKSLPCIPEVESGPPGVFRRPRDEPRLGAIQPLVDPEGNLALTSKAPQAWHQDTLLGKAKSNSDGKLRSVTEH